MVAPADKGDRGGVGAGEDATAPVPTGAPAFIRVSAKAGKKPGDTPPKAEPVIKSTTPRNETVYWVGAAGGGAHAHAPGQAPAVAQGVVQQVPQDLVQVGTVEMDGALSACLENDDAGRHALEAGKTVDELFTERAEWNEFGLHPVAPAGQDLVRITLVADIPDQPVAGRVENVVERDREFDRAQVGRQVPAGARNRFEQERTQLLGQQAQLAAVQAAQVVRTGDAF